MCFFLHCLIFKICPLYQEFTRLYLRDGARIFFNISTISIKYTETWFKNVSQYLPENVAKIAS